MMACSCNTNTSSAIKRSSKTSNAGCFTFFFFFACFFDKDFLPLQVTSFSKRLQNLIMMSIYLIAIN